MTQEEKAKRYDEAIERAKLSRLQLLDIGEEATEIEYIFPELKESEDEMIIKELISFVSNDGWKFTKLTKEEKKSWIAWLEKQKSTLPKWKYKKDNTPLLRDSIILNKYGCVAKSPSGAIVSDVWVLDYDELAKLPKEEIEKQGKLKPIDKVEPKFKVGDWIAYNHNPNLPPRKIIQITNEHYVFNNGSFEIKTLEADWHLWTIQDAKDGDVLVYGDNPADHHLRIIMLFKSMRAFNSARNHFHIFDDEFRINDWCDCGKTVHPATKEQRDLLFSKMNEAGYEFDFKDKELKKIEKQGEQKPKWSEEDKRLRNTTIDFLKDFAEQGYENAVECIDWLKSLKLVKEEQ